MIILEDKDVPEGAAGRRYGCRMDIRDARDLPFRAKLAPLHLPEKADLRGGIFGVKNQGVVGCCTGEAWAKALSFCIFKQTSQVFDASEFFVYWCERLEEGTTESDAGAQIRTGAKVLAKYGVPPYQLWPLIPSRLTQKPPNVAFAQALKHQALKYYRVEQDPDHIRACLAEGFPVVGGFSVYEGFEGDYTARTGIVHMPDPRRERMLGGHAILIVGYDDEKRWYICLNSWGAKWGDGGYFYMPYEYFSSRKYASDFWTLRLVEA